MQDPMYDQAANQGPVDVSQGAGGFVTPEPSQPLRTIYDDLPPFLVHVKDATANPSLNPDARKSYFIGENRTKTAEQIAMEQLQPQTVKPAALDTSQFDKIQRQIDELTGQMQTRGKTQAQTPDLLQIVAAFLLSRDNPEKLYEMLALPFQYSQAQAAETDAKQLEADKLRLEGLQKLLSPAMQAAIAGQRATESADQFNAQEANRMSIEGFRQGQMTERAGMKGPGFMYDQYLRITGGNEELALNMTLADPKYKEQMRAESEARVKTIDQSREHIVANLQATGKVLGEQAKNLAERTKYLGPEVGLKVAMFWLNLEQIKASLNAQNNSNALKMFEMQFGQAEKQVKALQDRIKSIDGEIEDLRKLQTDADRLAIYRRANGGITVQEAFNKIEGEIKGKQAVIDELRRQASEAVQVQLPDINQQQNPGGPPGFDIGGWLKNLFGGVQPTSAPKPKAKSGKGRPAPMEGYVPVEPNVPESIRRKVGASTENPYL